ncbi:MAG: hypothetical protein GX133_01460 [Syntrophomonadaceae bacterium]|nr:hypothetical protein [Syntrophomonadaceae bacterium]
MTKFNQGCTDKSITFFAINPRPAHVAKFSMAPVIIAPHIIATKLYMISILASQAIVNAVIIISKTVVVPGIMVIRGKIHEIIPIQAATIIESRQPTLMLKSEKPV